MALLRQVVGLVIIKPQSKPTNIHFQKIKKYKSAFSDEEDEGSQSDEPAPRSAENDSELETSDGNISRSMSSGSDDHVTETTEHNGRKR